MVRVCVGGEAAVRTVKVSAMVAMALCALAATANVIIPKTREIFAFSIF